LTPQQSQADEDEIFRPSNRKAKDGDDSDEDEKLDADSEDAADAADETDERASLRKATNADAEDGKPRTRSRAARYRAQINSP